MATAINTANASGTHDMRLVVSASAVGTIFEWYDFFIYGTLAASGIIGKAFFPAGNAMVQTLLAWAGFAVGFGFRPLGAVLFGYLGDRLGRKYTFLVTITVMGIATAGVGLVPSAAAIGFAAPAIILLLRIAQGLALGGEYGGAAIYVAEHAPPGRAGYYTSFIQAGVAGGFILSLVVVLAVKAGCSEATWVAWAWRLPFLFSLALLAVSLWMRLKLSESPVFEAIRAAGETARNPFVESFRYPGNWRRLFVAMIGIAAGLTVIWYTATFSVLSFTQQAMRLDSTVAQLVTGVGVLAGLFWFVFFGRLSDRIGRKRPIVIGYIATLLLLFPLFWVIGKAANPDLAAAAARAPVVVSGPACRYSPFAKQQVDRCGQMLDYFSKKGVAYTTVRAPATVVTVGGVTVDNPTPGRLDAVLAANGYKLDNVVPSAAGIFEMLLAIVALGALSGATYGPVAALLAEMFPPRIRYSSMSIPYHIGCGYFGGFLPFISQYVVARSGNPYAGLWYTWVIVATALVVTALGLKETVPVAKRAR